MARASRIASWIVVWALAVVVGGCAPPNTGDRALPTARLPGAIHSIVLPNSGSKRILISGSHLAGPCARDGDDTKLAPEERLRLSHEAQRFNPHRGVTADTSAARDVGPRPARSRSGAPPIRR